MQYLFAVSVVSFFLVSCLIPFFALFRLLFRARFLLDSPFFFSVRFCVVQCGYFTFLQADFILLHIFMEDSF